ncbi:Uncharacterised protein [Bacillus freudenreichii]|nr:Uncharacterised protein [Bacillus freudenreichii]
MYIKNKQGGASCKGEHCFFIEELFGIYGVLTFNLPMLKGTDKESNFKSIEVTFSRKVIERKFIPLYYWV